MSLNRCKKIKFLILFSCMAWLMDTRANIDAIRLNLRPIDICPIFYILKFILKNVFKPSIFLKIEICYFNCVLIKFGIHIGRINICA